MNDATADRKTEPGRAAPSVRVPGRLRRLAATVSANWFLKLIGIPGFIALFFVAYFWTLHSTPFPVTTVPVTLLDHFITFRPEALPLYLSLWVYVSLPPSLLDDRRELFFYGLAATALAVAGLAIFLFFPTTIARPDINWSLHPAFAFMKGIDAPGNACPSLHVAFAVFSAIWLDRLIRRIGYHPLLRVLNVGWCAGIMYSTLATKQHVALDLLAGTVFGMIGAAWKSPGAPPAKVCPDQL
jgi:membrane-associated phospholipid phosphatase